MWSTYARVAARTLVVEELAEGEDEEAYAGSSRREMSAWRVFGWYADERDECEWWWCSGMSEDMWLLVEEALASLVVDGCGEWSYMVVIGEGGRGSG